MSGLDGQKFSDDVGVGFLLTPRLYHGQCDGLVASWGLATCGPCCSASGGLGQLVVIDSFMLACAGVTVGRLMPCLAGPGCR